MLTSPIHRGYDGVMTILNCPPSRTPETQCSASQGDRCGIDVQDRLDPSRFTAAILGAVLPGDWARRFAEHADPAAELTRLWVILEAALKWREIGRAHV